MKISEIITDKYKLRIPPTVYYELLADVQEVEEQEPTTKNDLGVDCISRADVKAKKTYSHERHEYVVPVAEIDWLPSVTPQEPRWIPIGDYLPVTEDEVLVTYIVNGNYKKRYVETANYFNGEWSSIYDEYRILYTKIEILAWMPLPKPYEPRESEDNK